MLNRKIYITESEFINWLKGYLDAINANSITYKEYEKILEKLVQVKSKETED